MWQLLYTFSDALLLKSIKKDLSGAVSTLQIKTRKIKAHSTNAAVMVQITAERRTHLWLAISLLLGSMERLFGILYKLWGKKKEKKIDVRMLG